MFWPFSRKKVKINNSHSQPVSNFEQCNNDPDCPMCHISDDVVKQLQANSSDNHPDQEKK